MAIPGIGANVAGLAAQGMNPAGPGQSGPGAAGKGQSFEAVLQSMESQQVPFSHGTQHARAAADLDRALGSEKIPGVVRPGSAEMNAVSGAEALGPAAESEASGPAMGMLETADQSYTRMNEIIDHLGKDGPLTMQEVLQFQLEIHKVSLQLETTTKAVSEAVSDVKQLFQQQI